MDARCDCCWEKISCGYTVVSASKCSECMKLRKSFEKPKTSQTPSLVNEFKQKLPDLGNKFQRMMIRHGWPIN